jgi:hypothetical protein
MKIETKCQGSEFEKFDSVMRALIAVPKTEIADKPKRSKGKKRRKSQPKKS